MTKLHTLNRDCLLSCCTYPPDLGGLSPLWESIKRNAGGMTTSTLWSRLKRMGLNEGLYDD